MELAGKLGRATPPFGVETGRVARFLAPFGVEQGVQSGVERCPIVAEANFAR